jgi:phosphatidylethanolamine/phosphatidyl-N-methylethanolamine N-methyltransferase
MSAVYDYTFGPVSHPGRVEAIRRMGIRPGDRMLEVGVGTGINASLYPRSCAVTGVDFSPKMLSKAQQRIERKGVENVRLLEMDATNLKFANDSFDIVYAPYVISVVPDPIAVTREMWRVCRPGGRVIILNHFLSESRVGAWLERLIAPFTPYLGFKSDLDRPAFIAQANLTPLSIETVNGIWSLITCVKK